MLLWINIRISMTNPRYQRGLVDTSVIIALEFLNPEDLPVEFAVSAITLAELAAGPHATSNTEEKARRQDRLQRIEALVEALPVDTPVARAYGRIYNAVAALGRKPRGRRAFDLLIAATALAENLPLFTANPDDFAGLDSLIRVISVDLPHPSE
jgi:hypothetical protein